MCSRFMLLVALLTCVACIGQMQVTRHMSLGTLLIWVFVFGCFFIFVFVFVTIFVFAFVFVKYKACTNPNASDKTYMSP